MRLTKIEIDQDKRNTQVDIWSVQNKGIFIKGEQKLTYEKLRVKNSPSLTPEEDAKLKKSCQDFESFFLYYLLKQMRAAIPQGGIMQETRPLQFYREMFDEAVAEKISQSKGIGLAEMLYKNVKQGLVDKISLTEIKLKD